MSRTASDLSTSVLTANADPQLSELDKLIQDVKAAVGVQCSLTRNSGHWSAADSESVTAETALEDMADKLFSVPASSLADLALRAGSPSIGAPGSCAVNVGIMSRRDGTFALLNWPRSAATGSLMKFLAQNVLFKRERIGQYDVRT